MNAEGLEERERGMHILGFLWFPFNLSDHRLYISHPFLAEFVIRGKNITYFGQAASHFALTDPKLAKP